MRFNLHRDAMLYLRYATTPTCNRLLIVLACAATAHAAPPIELELATERGVQITAPQEWLQLLAGIGIEQRADSRPAAGRRADGRKSRHARAAQLSRRRHPHVARPAAAARRHVYARPIGQN